MALNTAHATKALARVHLAAFRSSARELLAANRTMALTITAFLGCYSVVAYLLVSRGLKFVEAVPLLGPMLTERLVYMLFFSFFVMLVVSNATITGMGLFRRKETGWLLSLPLTHRSLVLWKTMEGMLLASWGLLMLSAPLLGAVKQLFDTDFTFYLLTLPALLCLVAVSAHLSTWVLLATMRWMKWSLVKPVLVGIAVALAVLGMTSLMGLEKAFRPTDMAVTVGQILRKTEAFTHPMLPSSWVAEAVLAAGRGQVERAWFYNLTLLSWALAAVLLTLELSTGIFYQAWTRSLLAADTRRARSLIARLGLERWLPFSRVSRSLILKDVQTFAREPAQWGQSVVIFGLLFLYMSNLRRIVFDSGDGFWSVVTSYLNLLVCTLALSTLTTRFVFPQVSIEGQRIWMLGLAPIRLEKVLSVKLWLATVTTGAMTATLTALSCWALQVPLDRTIYFLGAVCMMALGLNGLALGLGTIFPNFKEANPARVVSGFGGTICLIASFVYLALSMVAVMLPALSEISQVFRAAEAIPTSVRMGVGAVALAMLTAIFGGVPYFLAKKRIKNLDYFGVV
ncbi:MAG: hypothetical protein JNJ83_08970 [Verrucomicrobiaceae bacterium]|nr:hypothetical protein [Verrucomicrobiaceae bacterium]